MTRPIEKKEEPLPVEKCCFGYCTEDRQKGSLYCKPHTDRLDKGRDVRKELQRIGYMKQTEAAGQRR